MFVCYALIDPRDTTCRYVGMTNNLYERFITHLRATEANLEKNNWILELRGLGLVPICRTLQVVDTERECRAAEHTWIEAFMDIEQPLFNTERIGKR